MTIKKLYLLGRAKTFKILEKKIAGAMFLYTVLFSSVYANSPYIEEIPIQDDQSVWIALFGLALVGVFTLFLSSDKVKNLIGKYEEMIRVQTELAQKQHKMLEFVGEKIETSTKGIIRHREVLTKNSFRTMNSREFNEELKLFKETESVLLDATHELVDFLKIKSGRFEIVEEQFKLSNMLNEVFGFVSAQMKKNKIEMLYDVDKDISTEILGDSKRLEQILTTLASDMIEGVDNSLLSLSVTKRDNLLTFTLFNRDKKISSQDIANMFSGELLEESSFGKKRVDLYIVNEIVKQMNGTIEVTSSSEKGTQYSVILPYKINKHISLPNKKIENRKILVFEKTADSAEAIAKMLMCHSNNVDYCTRDNIDTYLPSLSEYDMLFIDNSLFSDLLLDKIGKDTEDKKPYVVVLKNSFDIDISQDYKVDAKLYRPLQSENFLNLLNATVKGKTQIYNSSDEKFVKITPLVEKKGMNRESFSDFSYAHILIVEDNYINQKILKGLLGASGMKLTIVSSGREALKLIKSNSELDMVLMDSNMPMMDGYETTKEIRKIYNEKQLPVVMIIGEGFKNDIDKISKAGANTFLHKPFLMGTLYNAFETFVTKEKSKVKNVSAKLTKYIENRDILNIQKGITKAHSAIFYKELLGEVLLSLKESDLKIEEMITKHDMINLQNFILQNIHFAEKIGAKRLLLVLKEMNMLFIYKEEIRLKEYIHIYKRALNNLTQEADKYLKSSVL